MTKEQIERMTREEELVALAAPLPVIEREQEWDWRLLAEFIEGVLECAE